MFYTQLTIMVISGRNIFFYQRTAICSQTWGSSLLERILPLTMVLWLHTAEADINMPGKALFRAGVTAMQRQASQHCSDRGSSERVEHGYAEEQLVNNFLGHTLRRVAANLFFLPFNQPRISLKRLPCWASWRLRQTAQKESHFTKESFH